MNAFIQNSYFPSTKASKHAFKATFAALLALYIAFILDLSQPHWAATTALIVAQPQAGMALSKGLTRLVGTLIGTVLAIIVMSLFSQTPWLFLCSIAVIVLLCTILSTSMRNIWSYSFMMIGITTAIILIPNMLSPTTIFDYAVERFLEISLGIISSSLIFAVLWPIQTHQILINDADKTINLGFNSAIKSIKGEVLDDAFLQSLSNIVAVDAQREHAIFEGKKGKNSANAILGMCQNILHILSLARSINRDKQNFSNTEWIMISPWIQLTIEALEKGTRTHLKQTLDGLKLFLKTQHKHNTEKIQITLHRLELLLKHAIRARRFLQSARTGQPIKLISQNRLSQHKNYTLGFIFGLRTAIAFLSISFIWYLTGWSLINAIMPLTMSIIICTIFAGKENADKLSLLFCKGSIYTAIISLVINTFLIPNTSNFIMLTIVLGIPIFICTMTALIPKYFIIASLPINLLMLVHPSNHSISSTEYLLNQSLGLILGAIIASISIHLISINMPYWHGRSLKRIILKDLIRLIHYPLNTASTWFNARMADRLILVANHKELIATRTQYSWNNAILALDLGDEIFFLRRFIKYHPNLEPAANIYFNTLQNILQHLEDNMSAEQLEFATHHLHDVVDQTEPKNSALIIRSSTSQIQEILHNWSIHTTGENQ